MIKNRAMNAYDGVGTADYNLALGLYDFSFGADPTAGLITRFSLEFNRQKEMEEEVISDILRLSP